MYGVVFFVVQCTRNIGANLQVLLTAGVTQSAKVLGPLVIELRFTKYKAIVSFLVLGPLFIELRFTKYKANVSFLVSFQHATSFTLCCRLHLACC